MEAHSISLPAAAVTGIGSLPFRDPYAAVQFVAQVCPQVPFWPELPQRAANERSVEQVCTPFDDLLQVPASGFGYELLPGRLPDLLERLHHASARLVPERSAGFFAFDQALLAGQFARASAIKGQLVGPLTLGWQIRVDGLPLLAYPEALAALQAYIVRLAQWQVERLARSGKAVLLFLDEPCLALVPPETVVTETLSATLQATLTALRGPGLLLGIHTCATTASSVPVSALCQARPDVISFDAHHGIEAFNADPDVQAFLAGGGRVAYGLVPTWSQLEQLSAQELLLRWLVAVPESTSATALARQSLMTATCGLGLLPETAARESFRLANELGQQVARIAR